MLLILVALFAALCLALVAVGVSNARFEMRMFAEAAEARARRRSVPALPPAHDLRGRSPQDDVP